MAVVWTSTSLFTRELADLRRTEKNVPQTSLRIGYRDAPYKPPITSVSDTVYCKKDVLTDFIKNCKYQQAATDYVLIWRGKFTQSFSLIMKGSVSLHLDGAQARDDIASASISLSKDADTCDSSTPGTSRLVPNVGRRRQRPRHPAELMTGNCVTGLRDDNKKLGQSPKSMKFLTSYGAGESLFDWCLFSDMKPAGVTAICTQTTHLLFSDNDSLSDSMLEVLREEVIRMRMSVQTHPLFCMVPQRLQSVLLVCMRRERYSFDTNVVQQGSPVDRIFIIRSGQAKILIESNQHQHQYPLLWPFESETDSYDQDFQWLRESRKSSLIRKSIDPVKTSIRNEQTSVRRKEGYVGVEKWLKNRVIGLCTVSAGEVLADIELCLGLATYLQTVTTLHQMTVYALPVNGLERIIGRSYEQEIYRNEILSGYISTKLENKMNAKYGQQIPLLKCLHRVLCETLRKKKSLSAKADPKSKRNERRKNPMTDHFLPPVKTRKKLTKESSTDSGIGASLLSSLAFSEKDGCETSHQRRPPIPPLFERLHGVGGQEDGSDINVSESRRRRIRNRRRPDRSFLQLIEAIQHKLARDQFQNSHLGGKKDRMKARNQSLSDKVTRQDANLDRLKWSVTFPASSVASPLTDSVLALTEDQPSDSNVTSKLDRKQLPEFTARKANERHSDTLPEEIRKPDDNSSTRMNNLPNFIISKTILTSDCNKTDLNLTTEESKQIQKRLLNIPYRPKLAELVSNPPHDRIFETEIITSDDPDDRRSFYFEPADMTKIVADCAELTPREMQMENKIDLKRIGEDFGADKEHPNQIKLPALGTNGANCESSNHSLSNLEERLRQFHQDNLDSQYKYTLKLPSLKRYEAIELEVDGETYDGPRPGGKVLIRKRKCRFQGFFAYVKDHKHTHYHMVDSIPNLPIIDPYKRTGNM